MWLKNYNNKLTKRNKFLLVFSRANAREWLLALQSVRSRADKLFLSVLIRGLCSKCERYQETVFDKVGDHIEFYNFHEDTIYWPIFI